MKPLLNQLLRKGPVLLDGAWGTQLQQRGLAPGEFPDSWNLSHPEKVLEVAQAYVRAGSDIILTNTFGANRLRLSDAGLESDLAEINRQGVLISKAAAGHSALVFASIGPSGKMLLSGDVSPNDLYPSFEAQVQALALAGPDALVIETMGDLAEAQIALECARHTSLPIVVCMVFDSGKERDRTMMGQTPEQIAEALAGAGADVIGFNCGQGIETVLPLCKRLKQCSSLPIWAKPNAGMPVMVDGQAVYQNSPVRFASWARSLVENGANFVGGCCGTSPEYIQALRVELAPLRSNSPSLRPQNAH